MTTVTCAICGREVPIHLAWLHRWMRAVDTHQATDGRLWRDLGLIWTCGKCNCKPPDDTWMRAL